MIKKSIFCLVLAGASAGMAWSSPYKVVAPLTEDEDGAMAFIVNYDNGEKVDSVLVADASAVFTGDIDKPIAARLIIDGKRAGTFFLEPGEITINQASRSASGTALNDAYNELGAKLKDFGAKYQEIKGDSEEAAAARKAIQDEYNSTIQSAMTANIDNPLGYLLFIDMAYGMSLAELKEALAKTPSLKEYTRVNNLLTSAMNKEATSVGNMYKDFEIKQPDGTVKRLSDYVGKGKYTLVDFWASWCGPCIRETAVIKDLYNEYGPKGLDVLGVAVWDKVEDTRAAIEKHSLPWPQILDAQTVATDLYGIPAIPCIILFDPDGKIVSRDKQDEALRDDVKKAMAGELGK